MLKMENTITWSPSPEYLTHDKVVISNTLRILDIILDGKSSSRKTLSLAQDIIYCS